MAEALEPCTVYLLPYDKFMRLTEISWEINMFYRKILEYSLIVSQVKADSWRFETARERYNMLMHTHPKSSSGRHCHISSYLLMTRNSQPCTLGDIVRNTIKNIQFLIYIQIIFPKTLYLCTIRKAKNRISFYR